VITQKTRCREITEADLDAVADLLTRGFVGRSRDYWMQGLRRQAARTVPQGYPRFGYMLDNDGTPVGVLLLLYTFRDEGGEPSIYCNLSSWYVEPAFRNYATLTRKSLTSISARRHGPGRSSRRRGFPPIAADCSFRSRRCRAPRGA
jgi:hypothetical protein